MTTSFNRQFQADILIVGGGTGGVAAALAIARTGGRCIITEPTDWLGGQLTSQAVPPDENRWIERNDGVQQPATRSYLELREAVRTFYRQHRSLTAAARSNPHLNPGNGWVSHLCFEPAIGHAVLQAMLAEHIAAGRIEVLYDTEPMSVLTDGDHIRAVRFQNHETGEHLLIVARYFLDATECGDLLPLAEVEHAVGAESREVHGELHARVDRTDPFDQQAISWCFAVEHRAGEDHTVAKPANYDFWRDYTPPPSLNWPGKLFSWTVVGGDEHKPRTFRFIPSPDEPAEGELEMWRYRRIRDGSIYKSGSGLADIALINMVQMDYFQKPTLDVLPLVRQQVFEEARQQSLAFLHWMQTEAPRHDSDTQLGYPGLKLRGDVLGTSDGFAKFPYIRESRRLRARTTITERHVSVEQRKLEGLPQGSEPFHDSIGIGHYRLDLHPSTAMRSSIYVETSPFRIPLGALIPIRVRNLLAAGKNLGVTHITNGCYRLHPIEWNVGEAAGLLAQHCLATGAEPQQIHESPERVRAFQALAVQNGIPLTWPWENQL